MQSRHAKALSAEAGLQRTKRKNKLDKKVSNKHWVEGTQNKPCFSSLVILKQKRSTSRPRKEILHAIFVLPL